MLATRGEPANGQHGDTFQKGILDLRATQFSDSEPHELSGEWEFYWDVFLSSQDFQASSLTPNYRKVPLPWSEAGPGYPVFPAFGKATYRLQVLLPGERPSLILRIPETFTAFNIFINGKPIAVPVKAGRDAASTRTTRKTVYVPIETTESRLEIVMQVANYVSGTGGLWRAMHIGSTDAIMNIRSRQQFQTLMAVCCLGIMGLYHYILYLFRRDHIDNLWFSLFCLSIFVRSFFVGTDLLIYNMFDEFEWTLSRRIEFITFYISLVFAVAFLKELFPKEMGRTSFKIIAAVALIAVTIVAFQPHVVFRKTLLPMQIVGMFTIVHCCVALVMAWHRKLPQARIMLAGFLTMAFFSLHDILNSILRFDTLELTSAGVVACVVATSIVISKRFSNAFDELRVAQEEIRKNVEVLDQLVKEKTLDIRSIFSNIPQAIFAVQRDGYINAETSDYFQQNFKPQQQALASDVFTHVFGPSSITSDQLSQIISVVDFSLGESVMNFQINQSLLPRSFETRLQDQKRSFDIDWNPIADEDDVVQKVLVCMRDVTEVKELRAQSLESERRVKILAELLDSNRSRLASIIQEATLDIRKLLEKIDSVQRDSATALRQEILRILHTQKGNVRSQGLGTLANSIHAAEQQFVNDPQSEPNSQWREPLQNVIAEFDFTLGVLRSLESQASVDNRVPAQFIQSLFKFLPSSVESLSLEELRTLMDSLQKVIVEQGLPSLDDCLRDSLDQLQSLAKKLKKPVPVCQHVCDARSASLMLLPPLESALRGVMNHLLANAMDHGIEAPKDRIILGKIPQGQISLVLREEAFHWVVSLADDGGGLPRAYIMEKLKNLGWPCPESDNELAQVLLKSGFSTKDKVTDISGRGVGLDAVHAAMLEVGGSLVLHTRAREGANPQLVFDLYLPKNQILIRMSESRSVAASGS